MWWVSEASICNNSRHLAPFCANCPLGGLLSTVVTYSWKLVVGYLSSARRCPTARGKGLFAVRWTKIYPWTCPLGGNGAALAFYRYRNLSPTNQYRAVATWPNTQHVSMYPYVASFWGGEQAVLSVPCVLAVFYVSWLAPFVHGLPQALPFLLHPSMHSGLLVQVHSGNPLIRQSRPWPIPKGLAPRLLLCI